MTYEPEQVRLATALADMESTVDRLEALAKQARNWPSWAVRVECSHIRALIAALRKEPPPAKVTPLRKFALVQSSGRPPDHEIERKYLDATDPCPRCEAEKGPSDAG